MPPSNFGSMGSIQFPSESFGHISSFVCAEEIFVVRGALEKEFLVFRLVQNARELGDVPVVVAVFQRDGDGLALLEGMDAGYGFLFAGPKRRHVSVLVVEIIQRAFGCEAPWKQGDFERSLADSFIGGRQIEVAARL